MRPASESFVSCHLMVDSMWEDMNDDGQRIFWLPDACLTQCEKTGVATAKSRMFVTCVDFAPLWVEMLYRPCQDFDHSENVAFVRQTEFYRFCICCFDNQLHTCSALLRPGTFPLCRHRRIRGWRRGAAVIGLLEHTFMSRGARSCLIVHGDRPGIHWSSPLVEPL